MVAGLYQSRSGFFQADVGAVAAVVLVITVAGIHLLFMPLHGVRYRKRCPFLGHGGHSTIEVVVPAFDIGQGAATTGFLIR